MRRPGFSVAEVVVAAVVLVVLALLLLPSLCRAPRGYYEGKDQFYWMRRLQEDPGDEVAATALGQILLTHRFHGRGLIVRSLGAAGPGAKAALPALRQVLGRPRDRKLRGYVRRAIEAIEGRKPGSRPAEAATADTRSGINLRQSHLAAVRG